MPYPWDFETNYTYGNICYVVIPTVGLSTRMHCIYDGPKGEKSNDGNCISLKSKLSYSLLKSDQNFVLGHTMKTGEEKLGFECIRIRG